MAWIIPLTIILLPILEIALFIEIGAEIGVWATISLILLTGLIGIALIAFQGMATLRSLGERLRAERRPFDALFDTFAVLVAGFLLIVPGFLTDGLALLLLVPPVRKALRRGLARTARGSGWTTRVQVETTRGERPPPRGPVIDVPYEDLPPAAPGSPPDGNKRP